VTTLMTRMTGVEEPELPFPAAPPVAASRPGRSVLATFDECPRCGGAMAPEHAHFRCTECGWRDSCCD
jgi:ribosomal protein S27AE